VNPAASVHQIQPTVIVPAAMPINIAVDRTRELITPTRNAPSTGPDVSDSTDNPESSRLRSRYCAPNATNSCTMPQNTVNCFDSLSSDASSASFFTYFT